MDAIFVPPPPEILLDGFSDWEKFVNDKSNPMPELIQCALMHERFETLHPYLDGNGRIGRLLVTLFLIERGRLSQPLLHISTIIERTKLEYYDRLQRVRTHGEVKEWVEYFLRCIEEAAAQAIRGANQLLALRDQYRKTKSLVKEHRAQTMIDHLFINPYTTVEAAARTLECGKPTANKTLKLLERTKLLRIMKERSWWGRLWEATPILRAISGSPK